MRMATENHRVMTVRKWNINEMKTRDRSKSLWRLVIENETRNNVLLKKWNHD